MSDQTGNEQAAEITTIEEMIQELNLDRIQYYELSATYDDDHEPIPEGTNVPINAETSLRQRVDGLDFRLALKVPYSGGHITVDGAIQYSTAGPREFNEDAIGEFADNVAIMSLYPYIRQAANDLGSRMGDPVTLPLIKRGMISFRRPTDSAGN